MTEFLENFCLFVTILIGIMAVLGLGLFFLSYATNVCGG